MSTPLRDRIAARHGIPVQRPAPEPAAKAAPTPEWIKRLTAKDCTGLLS